MNKAVTFLSGLSGGLILASAAMAEESVEFVAEHLLEVPMDARALAAPLTPSDTHATEWRLQMGYGHYAGGRLVATVPMLSTSYFYPLADDWGLLANGFYDRYGFSGSRGNAHANILSVDTHNQPQQFNLNINNISGSGRYAGGSLAITFNPADRWRWQLGYARASLNIREFSVDFSSTDLGNNFSGRFDYAHNYPINALFVIAEMRERHISDELSIRPHLILQKNFPRVGFYSRYTGPGFDYRGDTDSNHKGTHIPDDYFGLGATLVHSASGISLDFGASLFNYAFEPTAHRGIKTPLTLSLSMPLH